jgi:hypothetical protein
VSQYETIEERVRRLERQLARQKRRAALANEAAVQLRLDVLNLRRRAVYAEQQATWWKDDATRAFYSNVRTLRGGKVVNTTEHIYLSTGCYHGDHGYCQSPKGAAGVKESAKCKHCDARCRCACHGQEQS